MADDGADTARLAIHIRTLKIRLVINLTTAKALGFEVLPICSRADQVVEESLQPVHLVGYGG